MKLLSIFRPDEYVESIGRINLLALWAMGKRLLIIDVDNTVALKGEYKMTDEAWAFVAQAIEIGFKVVFLSNVVGGKKRVSRVKKICRRMPSFCARWPHLKPNRWPFLFAVALGKLRPDESAVVIGDQLFTDIFGAKRLGLYAILVKPLGKDHIVTAPKRWLEWLLIRHFKLTPS